MPDLIEEKRVKKPLVIVLLVIVILLLIVTGVFAALAVSGNFQKDEAAGGGTQVGGDKISGVPITPTPTGDITEKNEITGPTEIVEIELPAMLMQLENLEQEVAVANAGDLRGFTALVEQIGGKQYLTFSNGVYKVSYKNELPLTTMSSVNLCEVIISNGKQTETFYWDYYAESGNVAKLCPYVGDFCKNGREQLAFSFLADGNDAADTLHVVAGNNLQEYYVIQPEAALDKLITVNGYLDAGKKTLADISSDNRNYYSSLPECRLDLAEEVYAVKTNSHLTYEIKEDGIVLQSFVEIGEGQFVGRIRGNIAYSSRDVFRLSSPSFYAFAEDDFCDVDSMGIVMPVTEAELPLVRIPVTGDGGERLLVRAREEIPFHELKAENFKYDENGFLAYYENGVKKTMTGIDVSKWQYDVNWKKVKAAGVDYALIRLGYRGTASEGNCVIDPYFEQNIKGALEAGLQVGVYYFTQAITEEEAMEEANIVIDALKGYNITFPVVYDTEYREDGRANDLSNEERTAYAKAFCDTILAAGYTPVVYSSTNWAVLDLDLEKLTGYDFWYAYYGDDIYYPYQFSVWQYTSSGKVDGIKGNADLNISLKDYGVQ